MKVRLKHHNRPVYRLLRNQFQFHEGPIKTQVYTDALTRYCSFNSMKVRLKREKVEAFTLNLSPFQFHEGPIKTRALPRSICPGSGFQFHEGPIKTSLYILSNFAPSGFNSMKVRLKPYPRESFQPFKVVSIP